MKVYANRTILVEEQLLSLPATTQDTTNDVERYTSGVEVSEIVAHGVARIMNYLECIPADGLYDSGALKSVLRDALMETHDKTYYLGVEAGLRAEASRRRQTQES